MGKSNAPTFRQETAVGGCLVAPILASDKSDQTKTNWLRDYRRGNTLARIHVR